MPKPEKYMTPQEAKTDGTAVLIATYSAGEGTVSVRVNYYDPETNITLVPEASCKVIIVDNATSPKPMVSMSEYNYCQYTVPAPFAITADKRNFLFCFAK